MTSFTSKRFENYRYYMPNNVRGKALLDSDSNSAILIKYYFSSFTRCVPQNCVLFPYSKSIVDQACSVKIAGYWPRSFFAYLWTSNLIGRFSNLIPDLTLFSPFTWPWEI